jgi:large subunit ribosomal protein L29
MKAEELREMSDEQLTLTMKEAQERLFRLRLQGQTEKLETPTELKRQRRLIAKAMTVLRERELAATVSSDS